MLAFTSKAQYRVSFDFNIVDREKLLTAYRAIVPALADPETQGDLDDDYIIKTVMANIDVLALHSGNPVGWLDLGLERLDG